MAGGGAIKRINVNLDARLHDQFKAGAAAQGRNMTEVLVELIRKYIRGSSEAKRTREEQQ